MEIMRDSQKIKAILFYLEREVGSTKKDDRQQATVILNHENVNICNTG
jgi:hypothetical protein